MNDAINNTGDYSSSGDDNDNYFREGTTDIVRNITADVISKLARERFTRDHGNAMIRLDKKDVSFIDHMIRSDRWCNRSEEEEEEELEVKAEAEVMTEEKEEEFEVKAEMMYPQ